MFARVMKSELPPDRIDDFSTMIRTRVIPRAREIRGFLDGCWLVDPETGEVIAVTLYESREALEASAEQAASIREESSREAGLPAPSFRTFEVVASARSSEELAA